MKVYMRKYVVMFDEISAGSAFMDKSGTVFMKVRGTNEAVDLETGINHVFREDAKVYLVSAKVVYDQGGAGNE